MRHFVQYHNPDRVGSGDAMPSEMSIGTNKPYGTVLSLLGNMVWLIGGEGRPRRYTLRYAFVVDEVGRDEEPPFQWYARGRVGHIFWPPLPIDRDAWFRGFLHAQANFSLGLRELGAADVEELYRRSGLCSSLAGD